MSPSTLASIINVVVLWESRNHCSALDLKSSWLAHLSLVCLFGSSESAQRLASPPRELRILRAAPPAGRVGGLAAPSTPSSPVTSPLHRVNRVCMACAVSPGLLLELISFSADLILSRLS